MTRRLVSAVVSIVGWGAFLLAIFLPALGLLVRLYEQGRWPEWGAPFGTRQLTLLMRSILLAGGGAALSIFLAMPGLIAVSRARVEMIRLLFGLWLAQLLCSPMVYALGWERILPLRFDPNLRCVLVSALWAWPIPAGVIGLQLRRLWPLIDLCRLEGSLGRSLVFGVGQRLAGPALIVFLVVFAAFFTDPTIPHACALVVFSTELQGIATSSPMVMDTFWPGILAAAPMVAVFIAAVRWLSSQPPHSIIPQRPGGAHSPLAYLTLAGLMLISWLLPVATLVWKHGNADAISVTFQLYTSDIAWSLGCGVLAGLAIAALGLVLSISPRAGNVAGWWTGSMALIPGTLAGIGLVAAYNRAWLSWIYDHWPMICLAYVARFGWVGALAGWAARRALKEEIHDQARIDGADRAGILLHLVIPMSAAVLGGCVLGVTALSLGELSASELVRIPAFQTVASLLVEKFHRLEDDILVALSLIPAMAALLAATGAVVAGWPKRRAWVRSARRV